MLSNISLSYKNKEHSRVLNTLTLTSYRLAKVLTLVKTFVTSVGVLAATTCMAQAAASTERWFEIEVILLQQLVDDTHYNEDFSELNTQAKRSNKHIDLIYQNLKNISAYKYLLPSCDKKANTLPFAIKNEQDWQELILNMPDNFGEEVFDNVKATTAPQANAFDNLDNANHDLAAVDKPNKISTDPSMITNGQQDYSSLLDERRAQLASADKKKEIGDTFNDDRFAQQDNVVVEELTEQAITQEDLDNIDLGIRFSDTSSDNDIKPFSFDFYCHYTDSDTLFRQVSDEFYQIPKQISGREDVYSSQPYLLTKDSLQLTHIYRELRRSREFRPLVHLAWRQPVFNARKAVPVKLIAGDNLTSPKQTQALADADDKVQTFDLNTLEAEKQNIINQHIASIVANVEANTIDKKNIINDIKLGKQPKKITAPIQHKIDNLILGQPEVTATNLQSWALEGLFKVHLNHYLFINSDFTIQIEKENKSGSDTTKMLVPFKQNRRVISGQIHYFDHPYMGMIVQIRRHSRPTKNEQ